MTTNYFSVLAAIDCSEHVEKKGRFSYLSWPWAVKTLLQLYPDSTWEVRRFDGMPFQKTESGSFVEVAVTVCGITRSQVHPVLDNNNKVIKTPTAFDINTSIQRALVKAIALHGLGLYIYAGEDLPDVDAEQEKPKKLSPELVKSVPKSAFDALDTEEQAFLQGLANEVSALIANDVAAACEKLASANLDADEKAAIWCLFDSAERSAMKKHNEQKKAA